MSALEPIPLDPLDELVVLLPAGEDLDLDDGLPSKVAGSSAIKLVRRPSGPKCNGLRHDGGGYCTQPMGWRTPHLGIGRCVLHGGMAPSSMVAALRIMAERACAALGLPTGTDNPVEAMRIGLAVSSGMVRDLGLLLAQTGDPTVPDHLSDLQRHVREVQLQVWVDTMTRIATSMARLGLDAREQAWRESDVTELSGVMLAVIDDPEFGLTHAARQLGRVILGRHLRRLGSGSA